MVTKELPNGYIFIKEIDGVVYYVDPEDLKVKQGSFKTETTISGYFHLQGENTRVTTDLNPNAVCQSLISHAGKPIDITRAYGDRLPQGKYILTVSISTVEETFIPAETGTETSKKK